MAGKIRHFLERDGRYYARLIIPKAVRPLLGNKTELRAPLGGDYRNAVRKHPAALAGLQHKIAMAEQARGQQEGNAADTHRYPLTVEQIASRNYHEQLAFDDAVRNTDSRYSGLGVDDLLAARLRDGMSGKLSDEELAQLVGGRIERFRRLGNTDVRIGTAEWRTLARAMCISEYEAMARVAERDEGDFTGRPEHKIIEDQQDVAEPARPEPLKTLFNDYVASRKAVGTGRTTAKRWSPIIADLIKFLGHQDARRITKQNLLEWRDQKLQTLSPKTVSDVYLAAVRSILKWAVENDRLAENVAADVRQAKGKTVRSREKGFTDAEALAILQFARAYQPPIRKSKSNTESAQVTTAKRWVPFLCAFSGARVSEMTQLRKEDFRKEGDVHVMRITPAAGTVKAGGYRDVPLHQQLIDLGFLDFLDQAPDGPLFYPSNLRRDPIVAAETVSARIGKWLQTAKLIPAGVAPSHAWRHRFKTLASEEGISARIADAIQGHAGRTAGDEYGDVTVKARKKAIDMLPSFQIES